MPQLLKSRCRLLSSPGRSSRDAVTAIYALAVSEEDWRQCMRCARLLIEMDVTRGRAITFRLCTDNRSFEGRGILCNQL
jgi:hypothetical protein